MSLSRRDFMKGSLASAGLIAVNNFEIADASPLTSHFPSHAPMGEPRGIFPGRVVWIHDPSSVQWDGVDFWWKPANFNLEKIINLINTGIQDLTGAQDTSSAWQALFEWRNKQNGQNGAYRPNQKIAIKTNMNGAGEYNDDPHGNLSSPYGNPVVLLALLKSLVNFAGVPPQNITVFDTTRIFPDYMREMCTADELKGVNFSFRDYTGKQDSVPDKSVRIQWSGDIKGEATYFPLCLTQADYLINLANLKGHSWGLTLGAKNHFGSFINSDRRRTPATAGLHSNIIDAEMGDYSVLVDLMAHKQINSKTLLWILDAVITAPSETGGISPSNAKWDMPPFNGYYAASMFLSLDPVALDSVGADFLVNEPVMKRYNSGLGHNQGMENYLHEASSLPKPPSHTNYSDGAGGKVASLGVHEHWNNAIDKQYSGNKKPGAGIELLYKKL